MFYRIPMDIIDMPVEVFLIDDQVRPKSALPYSAFSFA
jgi:hypothetical protein